MLKNWQEELQKVAHPEKIKIFQSFFKTGKGEYGEGDKFIGVSVPDNRKVAQKYFRTTFNDIATMLHHEIHEFRLSALLALVHRYKKEKNEKNKTRLYARKDDSEETRCLFYGMDGDRAVRCNRNTKRGNIVYDERRSEG